MRSVLSVLLAVATVVVVAAADPAPTDPTANITSAFTDFCAKSTSRPIATCTLANVCSKNVGVSTSACNILALAKTLQDVEQVPASEPVLQAYTTYCANNPERCSRFTPLAGQVNSTQYQMDVYKACAQMSGMEGCNVCTRPNGFGLSTPLSGLAQCDTLGAYTTVCRSMKSMSDCADFNTLCNALPNAKTYFVELCGDPGAVRTGPSPAPGTGGDSQPTPSPGTGSDDFTVVPPMRMFFHSAVFDYILFEHWITSTASQYTGAWFGIFFFTVLFYLFQAERIVRLNPRIMAALDRSASTVAREGLLFARALLMAVEVAWGFIIMLIIMSFNTGWFFAVILGGLFGNYLFGRRLLTYGPRMRTTDSADGSESALATSAQPFAGTSATASLEARRHSHEEKPSELKPPCC
ncbi:hypothetical protein RI367_002387 [Sorochytrium milnesiophthora]